MHPRTASLASKIGHPILEADLRTPSKLMT